MNTIAIIGLGGIGSRIALELGSQGYNLDLYDFDTYETRNRERQPLAHRYAEGTPKADAHQSYLTEFFPGKFVSYPEGIKPGDRICADLIICAVDTSTGRNAIRQITIDSHTPFLTVANETDDGETCLMLPEWIGTPLDPWITWPTLADPDPPVKHVSCTDTAHIELNPQTPNTNQLMAATASWLANKSLTLNFELQDHDIARIIVTRWTIKTVQIHQLNDS